MGKKYVRYRMDFITAYKWMKEGYSCYDYTRTTYKKGPKHGQLVNAKTGAVVPITIEHELSEWISDVEAKPEPPDCLRWPAAFEYLRDGATISNWHGDCYELRNGKLWMKFSGLSWEPCLGFDSAAGCDDHSEWFIRRIGRSGVIGPARTYREDEFVEVPLPVSPPAPSPRKLVIIIDLANDAPEAKAKRFEEMRAFVQAGL